MGLREKVADAVSSTMDRYPYTRDTIADAVMEVVEGDQERRMREQKEEGDAIISEGQDRVRELEEENQRLREDLACATGFTMEAENHDWINIEAWGDDRWEITRDGAKVAFVRGQSAALARARQLKEEK